MLVALNMLSAAFSELVSVAFKAAKVAAHCTTATILTVSANYYYLLWACVSLSTRWFIHHTRGKDGAWKGHQFPVSQFSTGLRLVCSLSELCNAFHSWGWACRSHCIYHIPSPAFLQAAQGCVPGMLFRVTTRDKGGKTSVMQLGEFHHAQLTIM